MQTCEPNCFVTQSRKHLQIPLPLETFCRSCTCFCSTLLRPEWFRTQNTAKTRFVFSLCMPLPSLLSYPPEKHMKCDLAIHQQHPIIQDLCNFSTQL